MHNIHTRNEISWVLLHKIVSHADGVLGRLSSDCAIFHMLSFALQFMLVHRVSDSVLAEDSALDMVASKRF